MKKRTTIGLFLAALAAPAQMYQHDAAGRLVAVTYSNGRSIRYSYDAADNLVSVEAGVMISPASRPVSLNAGGVEELATISTAAESSGGYATVSLSSGETPYGVAIFSLVQNGVVVFEAGVPASAPTTRSRVVIDRRSGVRAPAGQFQGEVSVDTGVAVVNPGATPARVRCTLRDTAGTIVAAGEGVLAPGRHIARLIGELNALAPDFRLPTDFATATRFGSLDVESDQVLAVTALRLTINQRGELLFTSTPVADLAAAPAAGPTYFPHLAEGDGFSSAFVLLNTSGTAQSGSLEFLNDDGAPLNVSLTDGRSGSSFNYAMPAGGVFVIETDGASRSLVGGWARVRPDAGHLSPVGAGSFRVSRDGIVVTESGIYAARPTTLARVLVDMAAGHDTGLAIANPGASALPVTLRAFGLDGQTPAGSGPATITIPAGAHEAREARRFVTGLPAGFRGVIEIASTEGFVALTVRSLVNSRGELLFATLPVADLRQPAPSPAIFPHIADGGGFKTELILLGGAGGASLTVSLYDDHGVWLPVIRP